jgi:hypothetical protein
MIEPERQPPIWSEPTGSGRQPTALSSAQPFRRRKVLLFSGIGLVVALTAGLLTWLSWPPSIETPRNRAPFQQALASLADAPGVRYTDTAITGQKRDITTTQFGEQFGVTSDPGNEKDDQGVLRVGGKLYTRFLRETGKLGKWTIGNGAEYYYDDLIKTFPSPGALSDKLSSAIADLPDLPAPGDPGLPSVTVGGIPALRADTSAGTLYVAKDAPYRVLRLEPQGLLSPSRLESLTALPSLPALPSPPAGTDSTGLDSSGMDLSPIDAPEAEQMYNTLADDTKQLSDAVDAGIDFSLTSAGTFNCNTGGCNVLESFTGTLSSNARTRIANGQITARLTVTNVTIDGRPAGGCVSAPTTIPVTGNTASGQLSCDDPEAGPVFAAVDQQYQQQAQQQANASGGSVTLTYYARADAEVDAEATGQAEVDQLLDQQKHERDSVACQTPNSFAPGTLVLLADHSTRPIEQVTPGTPVLTTDPATDRTTTEPVLADVTGTGPKQLDQLTISDGEQSATLTATAGHPFWDPSRKAWVIAGSLRPGETLAGLPGSGPVHVTGNRAYQAPLTVHNLTIAHTHTYYVLAGNTPVLVHNDDCPGKLAVAAQNPSASELRAARYLAGLGKDVILRDPVGTRAGGGTSDLLVDGVRWDVYTPKTANPDRIVSQVASKGSQVLGGGVIIDLSETTVSADQLGNIQSRVAGTGGRVSQIVVMP